MLMEKTIVYFIQMWKKIDISYNKYLTKFVEKMQANETGYKDQDFLGVMFDMFDKDKSGALSTEEMTTMFNTMAAEFGEPMRLSPIHVEFLMAEADVNKDGVCSKQEFFNLYKRIGTLKLNSSKFGSAIAVPLQKVEAPHENQPAKYEPPTLNMDQESFKKFKQQVECLEKKENITEEDYGAIADKILAYFDKDKSGSLETAEMINFFRAMDSGKGKMRGASEFQLNMVVSLIDPNKDGKLQRHELVQFLKMAIKSSKNDQKLSKKQKLTGTSSPNYHQSEPTQSQREMMSHYRQQAAKINPIYQQPDFKPTIFVRPKQVYTQTTFVPSWHYYPNEVQRVSFAYNQPN